MSDNSSKIAVAVGPKGVELKDLDQMFRFADCYIQSGLAPKGINNPQQLVLVWARAAELGIAPMQALEGMSIIGNRIGIMGDLALAIVRSSGLLVGSPKKVYKGEGPNLECSVTIKRKDCDEATGTYSMAEARTAKLPERNINYTNFPKRMLYYRALGFVLRDEFSDVLKNMHLAEELIDLPQEDDEEAKIASNQAREAEMTLPPGTIEVPSRGTRPTPAEAAEPAFPEDKPQESFAKKLARDFPEAAGQVPIPQPVPPVAQPVVLPDDAPEDDLDMSPAPEAPPAEIATPWKTLVIKSIKKFRDRTVGSLNQAEISAVESQWLPKVRAKWSEASEDQQAECQAFESALAYYKMVKPW